MSEDRTEKGQFAKGTKIRPNHPGPIKRTSKDAREILEAITSEFSVGELQYMLRTAWETAVRTDDWKGQMSVVQFIAYYAIGKPVQRSISASVDVDAFRRMLRNEEVDEAEYVEGEGDEGAE